jgi:putative membrane protein
VAELGGTGYGVPFGGYTYSNLLGPAWLGRVPVVIPLSWFCMALPSWVVSFRAYPDSVAGRVLAGSFILLVWDLALDPAMSHATRFWAWQEAGPYYGMPLLNLLGWFVTGALIVGSFEALGAARWARVLPRQWLLAFYAVNLLMPLGMCVAAGLWGAVLVTAGAVLGVSLWIRRIELLRARGERPAIGLELAR